MALPLALPLGKGLQVSSQPDSGLFLLPINPHIDFAINPHGTPLPGQREKPPLIILE